MSQPFIGEVRCFGFNFAPRNWAMCNGQLLQISQNTALFSLLGTTFGGNGQTTFALPDLRGQVPMHWGSGPGGFNTSIGEVLGSPTVGLLISEMPLHAHGIQAEIIAPGGIAEHAATPSSSAFIGPSAPNQVYNTSPVINASFSNLAIGLTGGSQPHENRQPYLVLNFCIALFGVFPSRN